MNFGVDFVPPQQFCMKRWWRPARSGAAWFYHTSAPSRPLSFMRDYSTVDPQIRGLVMFLHSRGMPTLPSCSGHWPKKQWGRRCFDELLQDAHTIRMGGLDMIDVESGVRVLCRDPYWQLPWGEWTGFLCSMREHDGEGYLCFWVTPRHVLWQYLEEARGLRGVKVNVVPYQNRLCWEIGVKTADELSQGYAWHSVDRFLRRLG
jgi:hypothetical protein